MSAKNSVRITDSSDRIVALSATSPINPNSSAKSTAARFSGTTRRILNALMRSLSTPHI
jgi:hypothetical protein